ncbi:MAG: YqeG family HAD IIIA-type phosphatase, partial [Candidatus Coatesbacteria bacterium]|nr:YqeG family HAD IIIA-type phosphatase [Candidatus Coatesbacteria bacterium]
MDSVTAIDLPRLRQMGIRALLVDLDNTLVPWRSSRIADEIVEWIRSAKDQGFSFCIVSNTRTWKRLEALAEE